MVPRLSTVSTTRETQESHKKKDRDLEKDAANLQLIESFLESTPQLALKMYYTLLSPEDFDFCKVSFFMLNWHQIVR